MTRVVIEKIELCNFRAASKLDVGFSGNMTVLAGINGAGKTTVLDALAILLSWLVNRILRDKSAGRHIPEDSIRNGENQSYIDIHVRKSLKSDDSSRWYLAKTRKGKTGNYRSQLDGASKLAIEIRENADSIGLPVFAYYPVHRNVLDIPLRIRGKHAFDQIECYDNALTVASNFRRFFEWFRNREDLENENRKYVDSFIQPSDFEFPDRQLEAVRKSVKAFLPGFKELSVRRKPLRMVVYKENRELRIEQLSDGEKNMIALVGDIARRLAIANPNLANPLEGGGVVMIDEIDLHLHPAWQRLVVGKLPETFPNIQFILTTHSPQVLGEVHAENIRCLDIAEDGTIEIGTPASTYGMTSNEILDAVMKPGGVDTLTRTKYVQEKLDKINRDIDAEKFPEAKKKIETLRNELGHSLPDLVYAESMVAMLEPETDGK